MNAAKGNRKVGAALSPHHPARFEDTTNVAAAKPYRPRIDGAATGCKEICAWLRQNSNSPSWDGAWGMRDI